MENKNPFSDKIKLSNKAIFHHKLMEKMYPKEIKNAVESSKVYTPSMCNIISETGLSDTLPISGRLPIIQLVDTDTVSALYLIKDFYPGIGLLNFASFKHPGGMYLKGSSAQEESLCHESILYEVLKRFDSSFYAYNRLDYAKGKIDNLYLNYGIYSPNIIFNRNSNIAVSAVITVAAPNARYVPTSRKIPKVENSSALKSRIKFVLDIAETEHLQTLILGAYGCGVFKQNPEEVANIFKFYLMSGKYNFTNIIFAIPFGDNYKAFGKVLKDCLSGIIIDES